MHEILEFLYCCASTAPEPATQEWFDEMNAMCKILTESELPQYDEDPFVVVSLFHTKMERRTLDLPLIMHRFIEGDVSTSVWGPIAWKTLHELARVRPDRVERLIRCWQHVLPCHKCRKHLTEHIRVTKFDFTSPDKAYQYTSTLHNAVNMQLGKKMFIE
jgi:hypothetical protein